MMLKSEATTKPELFVDAFAKILGSTREVVDFEPGRLVPELYSSALPEIESESVTPNSKQIAAS